MSESEDRYQAAYSQLTAEQSLNAFVDTIAAAANSLQAALPTTRAGRGGMTCQATEAMARCILPNGHKGPHYWQDVTKTPEKHGFFKK